MSKLRPMMARCVRAALTVRVLAMLLALASRLALGAMVPPDVAAAERIATLNAVGILCVGPLPARGDTMPHRPHATDLALCPLTIAMAQQAAMLTPAPAMLPPPSLRAGLGSGDWPPGRGPPPPSAHVHAPRAPPFPA